MNDWLRSVWLKPGNSDLAQGIDGVDALFLFITWVSIISMVLLMVPMVWWAWKYRRKPGVPPIRTPNHNTFLEVTWVVVPLIIVVVIFFWGFFGYMRGQIAAQNAETISITAFKWGWEAEYPNGAGSALTKFLDDSRHLTPDAKEQRRGNAEVPVFVVPEGRPVKFLMSSKDVIHSFYIPDMRIKMDVFPNRFTSLTFTPLSAEGPDQAGPLEPDDMPGRDHYVFCAEYCGTLHSEMAAILRVVPEKVYNDTITAWGNKEGGLTLVELGQYLHQKRGCVQCHSVDGTKNTGPSWAPPRDGSPGGWGATVPTSAGPVLVDENYIAESIRTPGVKIHAGYPNQMAPYPDFTDRQVRGVAAYMRSLVNQATDEDKAPPPPPAKP